MLSELCGYLKNWFEKEKHFGDFTIANGMLVEDVGLLDGQYFRIVGSVLNDGVYQYHDGESISELVNETFHGAVWTLAIPQEVIALNEEIDTWIGKYGATVTTPFTSENISASSYSYSKASASSGGGSSAITWQSTFASKLNRWRKI